MTPVYIWCFEILRFAQDDILKVPLSRGQAVGLGVVGLALKPAKHLPSLREVLLLKEEISNFPPPTI